jgi:hypothetical protein
VAAALHVERARAHRPTGDPIARAGKTDLSANRPAAERAARPTPTPSPKQLDQDLRLPCRSRSARFRGAVFEDPEIEIATLHPQAGGGCDPYG